MLVPVPNNAMMGFIIGAALLVLGMGLFTLGTDLAMTPIGQHGGNTLTRSKKMWVIALVGFIVGVLITLSEPDLQVLAEQVPGVPNMVLMIAVGVGVGLFLVVALMRIILAVPDEVFATFVLCGRVYNGAVCAQVIFGGCVRFGRRDHRAHDGAVYIGAGRGRVGHT